MSRKDDKPKKFKGVIAVLAKNNYADLGYKQDSVLYEQGDVIDYFDGDQDPGSDVWDHPNFEIVFIKNMTVASMEKMLVAQYAEGSLNFKVKRRAEKYDIQDLKVKNKIVWDLKDATDTKQNKIRDLAVQPAVIEVP